MKTIVFIGTQKSGSSREAIKAAEGLGYYTVLFTNRKSFLIKRDEFHDVHLMKLCDFQNIVELKNHINELILKGHKISAIISFVDPHCYTASLLAEEFGVNHFSTQAIANMLNKIFSKQALSESPYSSRFKVLTDESLLTQQEIEKDLPSIIKSPNSNGSKDVYKVSSYKDFNTFKTKLLKKYPIAPILYEEFLDGPQYLVEVLVYNNEIHIVAIVEQEITCCERFIVTGYNLIMNPEDGFYDKLSEAVTFIVKSHDLETGPCHLEMRYVNNQWKLIEINPRISGGGMNRLIEIGFGINLVEETLKVALGEKPNVLPRFKKYSFAQYVIISKTGILEKVTGKKRASRCSGVKEVYVKPRKGTLLTPPYSMGRRYAYVIATGDNEQQAKYNAKYAATQIKFWLSSSKKNDNR